MDNCTRPNLFKFATKELSQDALVAWLIEWADDRYAGKNADEGLHELGRTFVGALLGEHGAALPTRIKAEIYQQEKGIDVLARIGPQHVLLIEDKTGTSDHGNQLKRYYEHVVEGRTRVGKVTARSVYPIYLKTGNQSLAKERQIEDTKLYRVFNRQEFLEVLGTYRGKHPVVRDYRAYLQCRENRTISYRDWEEGARNDWSWESWEGFYREIEIQNSLDSADWHYVSNPAGGFLGFHWKWISLREAESEQAPWLLLQLEVYVKDKNKQKLCFKVVDVDKPRRPELKREWHERVMAAGDGKVVRPRVLRSGKTMTVGHWDGEWLAFSNGRVDFAATIANLKEAERILEQSFGLGG